MNKQKSLLLAGVTAIIMLVTVMAVIVGGFSEVTDSVRIAMVEDQMGEDTIIARADIVEGEVDESGFAKPLGESTVAITPEKTLASISLMKIQLAMIGIVGIGIIGVLFMLWRGSRLRN